MARKVDLALRETWRERIARQRRSGLTVAEFSRQEGVSTASFYRWQQALGVPSPAPAKHRARHRPTKSKSPALTAPRMAAPTEATFLQLPLTSPSTNPWMELMLTDGTLIRLPHQNLAALQTVLQACQGTSCVGALGAMRHV